MTGRPTRAVRPLEEQVERMARRGCTAEDVGDILGLSRSAVYRRKLQSAMARGRATMRENLRIAQLKSALIDRNPALLIFLGKQLLGQKDDPIVIEHTGAIALMSGDDAKTELLRRLARLEAAERPREIGAGD